MILQEKFGDDPQSFEYFLADICTPVNTIIIIGKCLSRFTEDWIRKKLEEALNGLWKLFYQALDISNMGPGTLKSHVKGKTTKDT